MESFGWLSLLPAVIALFLAIVTKDVLVSLFVGTLSGVVILAGGAISEVPVRMLDLLVGNLGDQEWNVKIILTVALMGGLVGILKASGASRTFANWASQRVKSRRAAQMATVGLGLAIFFDDYFNNLAVGSIMQPITDRFQIAREKLAYLIDATAAPICIMAPFSTWAAYILSLVAVQLTSNGLSLSPWGLFLQSVPYNFYGWLTLVMVAYLVLTGRSFGPMAKAEQQAYAVDQKLDSVAVEGKGSVVDLMLPIFVLVGVTVYSLLATGGYFSGATWQEAMEATDSAAALVYGAFAALLVAIPWFLAKRRLTLPQSSEALLDGMKAVLISICVLALAWSIGGVSKDLGTGAYLAQFVSRSLPTELLTVALFAVACFVSFATGTSWGTFALMVPLGLPLAIHMGAPLAPALGAVLAGGVFGDHCSPISDTTILSSTGAGCDHTEHVKTQLPYALVVAGASIVAYLISSLTGSWWLAATVSLVALLGSLQLLTRLPQPAKAKQLPKTSHVFGEAPGTDS